MTVAEPEIDPPPPGYAPIESANPFGRHNGPLFEKEADGQYFRGFRVLERHTNRARIAHGGMLMSFADITLGTVIWRETGEPTVTVRMLVDFQGPARLGDWVEGTARITRATRSLVFAEGAFTCQGHAAFTASGVFRRVRVQGD